MKFIRRAAFRCLAAAATVLALGHGAALAQGYPSKPITPMTLVGCKDLPAKDFKELQAYLKANASTMNLAHAGRGAVSHLCGMLFRQAVGAEITTVPYQGPGPAMNALLAGQVDLLCDQTTSTTPFIKAGSVKLYGVTTASRLKTSPDTPTLAEQSLAGLQLVVRHGIYAPKGTPKEAVDRFGAALRAALKDPAVATRLGELGAIIPPDDKLTPAGLQGWLQLETQRYGPVIDRVPLHAVFDWARRPSQPVVVVPGADHFFGGKLHVLRSLVVQHLRA